MTTLLGPRSDISMRSSGNKELDLLDDLFDQIVETELLQFNDNTAGPSSPDDLAHLFELASSNDGAHLETPPIPNWDSTEETWHKALRRLKHNPASSAVQTTSSSIYPESRGKASASDPELFSLDDLFELQSDPSRLPSSTPSTPTLLPNSKSKQPSSSSQAIPSGVSAGIRKSTRKATISPKMMRPSQYRAGVPDLWTRRIDAGADTFNIQLPPSVMPASPPPSGRLVQKEDTNAFSSDDQPYTVAMSPRNEVDAHELNYHSNYQLTPLASPAIDRNSTSQSSYPDTIAAAYLSQQLNNGPLSALQTTPPPTNRLPMTTWGPDSSTALDFSFSASPEYQTQTPNQKPQSWWAHSSAPQPSPSPYHHSRSSSQTLGFASNGVSSAATTGLGISCDSALNSFTDLNMSNLNVQGDVCSYAYASLGMPATTHHNTNNIHSTITPPSRSPSASPPPPHHRPLRERRFSSKPLHQHHQLPAHGHRRKSSQSSASGPRPASVGFVNFTPDDSRKILTGVAPSGSSKTKARREKEAAEKRRKLSQAATRAIIEAGGDLAQLEKEGLLIGDF